MAFLKSQNHNTFFYGWPVLLVGSLITIAFTYYAYVNVVNENFLRSQYESDEIIKEIEFQLNQYEELLLQTRGFIQSSEEMTRERFRSLIQNLDLKNRHPEIQAFGVGKRILQNELSQHLKKVRKEIPDYSVWPEGIREQYYPIVYLEPFDEANKKILGFDTYSEAKRQKAIDRAINTGETTLSGKVYLVQDSFTRPHPGLILYVPFVNKVPEFFYVAFRAESLFKTIFHGERLTLDVEIFDGDTNVENLIYDHDRIIRSGKETFTRTMKIYGKEFVLKFAPSLTTKNKSLYRAPCIVLLVGMLFTILIFRLFGLTKKSQIELGEALASRDEFISIASHELKTPITAIKLHTQMVKRNKLKINDPVNLSKMTSDHLNHTEILAQRLERLVDDMLDITRIRAGRLTVFKELVDVNTILREVLDRLQDQFKALPESTPEVNYGVMTTGIWDRHRIDQVITNLLTNALKYGEGKKIIITTSSTPTTVSISVKDHGIGISNEFHEKIFQRFERAGINSKGISGLGLGLYITQQIVMIHGGKIKVESEPGKGSTFIVELPKTC